MAVGRHELVMHDSVIAFTIYKTKIERDLVKASNPRYLQLSFLEKRHNVVYEPYKCELLKTLYVLLQCLSYLKNLYYGRFRHVFPWKIVLLSL